MTDNLRLVGELQYGLFAFGLRVMAIFRLLCIILLFTKINVNVINHSSFNEEIPATQGINIEVLFWYSGYLLYFSVEIFSVRPVEPKKSRFNNKAPIPV
jgi:hypothetical protein